MENLTSKNLVETLAKGGLSAALIVLLMYFGGMFLSSMQEMQKDLSSIRVELVKIQASIITQEKVEHLIDEKIKILQYKYHSKNRTQ